MDLGVATGAFALAIGGVRLLEAGVSWAAKKNGYHKSAGGLTERQALQLHDLHESHSPRMIELLKEIRDELRGLK